MKRWLGYGLLGLLAYVIFMLIQFPAANFIDLLGRYLPGLTAQEVQGSARKGTAREVRLHDTRFETLSWRFRPLALVKGRLEYRVIAEAPQLRLEGAAGVGLRRQLQIEDLSGRLPLPRAIALIGRPTLPLNGNVELNLTALHLDREGRPRAAYGTTRLLDTRTTLGRPLDLGDFSAELTTEDQTILGTIKDNGGPLELTGVLALTPDGRYRFTGQVALRDPNNQDLRQALTALGQPGADGKWQMEFTGVLRG